VGPVTLRDRGADDGSAPCVRVDPRRPQLELPRILCPADLSPGSERALALAALVADGFRGVLRTLRVVPADLDEATAEDLATFLERHRRPGLTVEARVVRGDAVGEILRHAEEWPASLIVIGSHGATGRKVWALGSVTAAVARRVRCPVITVPAVEAGEGPAPPAVRRVVCGVDLGGTSADTLAVAAAFARVFEADLAVVHVLEWFSGEGDPAYVPELQFDAADAARQRLRRLLPRETSPEEPEVIVAAGTPHRELLRVAREGRADLVVLGAHARRSLDRSLPGVQLVHLLREAPCPILVVPVGFGAQPVGAG
jgi:nucleotide-binding universal stress UspA family protein